MPTISEIESAVIAKSPYYFSDSTLEFFEQTKKDFKVKKSPKGKTFIYAPCRYKGQVIGYSFREFTGDRLLVPEMTLRRTLQNVLNYIENN